MSRFVEHEQQGLLICQNHWNQEWHVGIDVQEWADVEWFIKPGNCHFLQHHAFVFLAQKLDIAETFIDYALQRQSSRDLVKDLVQITLVKLLVATVECVALRLVVVLTPTALCFPNIHLLGECWLEHLVAVDAHQVARKEDDCTIETAQITK